MLIVRKYVISNPKIRNIGNKMTALSPAGISPVTNIAANLQPQNPHLRRPGNGTAISLPHFGQELVAPASSGLVRSLLPHFAHLNLIGSMIDVGYGLSSKQVPADLIKCNHGSFRSMHTNQH